MVRVVQRDLMHERPVSAGRANGACGFGNAARPSERALISAGGASALAIEPIILFVQRDQHIQQKRLNYSLVFLCILDAILGVLQTAHLTNGSHGHFNGLRDIPIRVVSIEFGRVIFIHATFVGSPDGNFRAESDERPISSGARLRARRLVL